MITSRQVWAARALLGWTQETLADKALVALTALKRLASYRARVRNNTQDQLRRALERADIVLAFGRGEWAQSPAKAGADLDFGNRKPRPEPIATRPVRSRSRAGRL